MREGISTSPVLYNWNNWIILYAEKSLSEIKVQMFLINFWLKLKKKSDINVCTKIYECTNIKLDTYQLWKLLLLAT